MLRRLQRVTVALLQAPIRAYRRFISPWLPGACRFTPTCSAYAMEALRVHGPLKGGLLALWRICRCNPWGKWGFDPVPPKGRWKDARRRLHPARLKK